MISQLPNTSQGRQGWPGFHQWEKDMLTCPGRGHANRCPVPQFQGRNHSDYLSNLFRETDLNQDRELTFEEFTIVLAKLTDDAHRISHGDDRCTPDKD